MALNSNLTVELSCVEWQLTLLNNVLCKIILCRPVLVGDKGSKKEAGQIIIISFSIDRSRSAYQV